MAKPPLASPAPRRKSKKTGASGEDAHAYSQAERTYHFRDLGPRGALGTSSYHDHHHQHHHHHHHHHNQPYAAVEEVSRRQPGQPASAWPHRATRSLSANEAVPPRLVSPWSSRAVAAAAASSSSRNPHIKLPWEGIRPPRRGETELEWYLGLPDPWPRARPKGNH